MCLSNIKCIIWAACLPMQMRPNIVFKSPKHTVEGFCYAHNDAASMWCGWTAGRSPGENRMAYIQISSIKGEHNYEQDFYRR